MLRERVTHFHKAAETIYKAAADMTTGMGVVKMDDGTFAFPAAATCANIFWLDKERIPTGINAARVDMSDYDVDFVTVKKDEFGKLMQYGPGERFATDAYATALTEADAGKTVAVGTDGKVAVATAASIYKFKGFYDDAGHILADLEVLDTPVANSGT